MSTIAWEASNRTGSNEITINRFAPGKLQYTNLLVLGGLVAVAVVVLELNASIG